MTERGKKIDIDKIDLEELKDKTTETPGLIEFPHSISSAVVRPEDKGKIKSRALAAMEQQTNSQMAQIYEQMQTLARQAKAIQDRITLSERIYKSQMSFEPLIGHSYYLYERKDGTDLLSMVAPGEWGRNFPFNNFLGRVKLLSDHTWEVEEKGQDID